MQGGLFNPFFGGSGGVPTTTSLGGWSTSNRYASANSTGPQADLNGFTVWAFILPNTSTSNQMIIGKSNSISSSQGWSLSSSTGSFRLAVGNGTAAILSPAIGFPDIEVGKMCILHGVIRSNEIFMYKNGVPVFGKTSIASYTSSAFGVNIGSFSGGTPFLSDIVACGICATTGLNDAQVEAHYQALLLDPFAVPTGATHLWKASTAGATWVDSISGLSCTRNGTITNNTSSLIYYNRYDYRAYFSDTTPLSPILPNTSGSIDVMFVGDSRTRGVGGSNTNSFRQGVCDLYVASGDITNMNFVGPTTSTCTDPEHDGNTGWTSGNHLTGIGAQISIYTAMDTYTPDIVVVYLGTNSASSDALMETERSDYMTLIRAIKTKNPSVRVVVIEETEQSGPVVKARLEAHNNWFWNTAWPTLISEGIQLIRVKMYTTIKVSDGDYFDSVHPTDAGYAKMVNSIYQGIRLATGRS